MENGYEAVNRHGKERIGADAVGSSESGESDLGAVMSTY